MKHTSSLALQAIAKIFILLICFPYLGISQNNSTDSKPPIQTFPTWEAGVFFGFGWIYGDLVTDVAFTSGTSQPAYGIMGLRNLNKNWAIRANLIHVKLKANDLDSKLAGHRARGFSHETPLTELSILGQWDMFGKRRYKRVASFNKTISPYLFAGIAVGMGKPEVFFGDRKELPTVLADIENASNMQFAIPFGGGVKFDLSQRSFVGLEFGFRPTFNDLLDGVSESGNPEKNDWYAFGGVTIGYRFATDDADGDGVVDAKDKCPGVAGDRRFRGCPDTDGDGVQDRKDNCPLIAGAKTMNGCPDSDLDGVADTEDECPNTKGMRRLQGCPDADWDNVIDKNDACPNTPGLAEFKGCPDTDRDGVMDLEDQCPEVAGLIEFKGCPTGTVVAEEEEAVIPEPPVKVSDTVLNDLKESVAEMPKIETTTEVVPEKSTDLKEETTIVETVEMPIEKVEAPTTKEVRLPNFELIRFATSSNELSLDDKQILEGIAATLPSFPDYKLMVSGYTDNIGNNDLNQKLSEKRAKACFDYLIKIGVDLNKISYQGYGEINPIATNNTVEGRAKNRRVEVSLVK